MLVQEIYQMYTGENLVMMYLFVILTVSTISWFLWISCSHVNHLRHLYANEKTRTKVGNCWLSYKLHLKTQCTVNPLPDKRPHMPTK